MTAKAIEIEICPGGFLVVVKFDEPMGSDTVRQGAEDVSHHWKKVNRIQYFLDNKMDVLAKIGQLLRDESE